MNEIKERLQAISKHAKALEILKVDEDGLKKELMKL